MSHVALNIADGLRISRFRSPSKVAVVQGERLLTFADVDQRANRLANALLGVGLRPGDHVGILLANVPEYVEIYFGLARAGLVAVPMSFRLVGSEIAFHLNDSGARALIYASEFSPQVEAARPDISTVATFVSVDNTDSDYETLLHRASSRPPDVQVD